MTEEPAHPSRRHGGDGVTRADTGPTPAVGAVRADDGGVSEYEGIPVPTRWPSAWPHLWHATRDRAAFVTAVAVLTVLGIAVAGDLRAQWWVPVVPVVLLTGPALRPGRARRALERSAARGRLSTVPGRLHAAQTAGRTGGVLLVTSAGHTVAVPVARTVARVLASRHAGEAALLVWAPRTVGPRGAAALVLAGSRVAYLREAPPGARPVGLRLRPAAGTAVLVRR
jgi:hypothetical protein